MKNEKNIVDAKVVEEKTGEDSGRYPKTEKKAGLLVRGATKVENGIDAVKRHKWKILGGLAGLAALGGLAGLALHNKDKDNDSGDVVVDVVPEELNVSEGEEL